MSTFITAFTYSALNAGDYVVAAGGTGTALQAVMNATPEELEEIKRILGIS